MHKNQLGILEGESRGVEVGGGRDAEVLVEGMAKPESSITPLPVNEMSGVIGHSVAVTALGEGTIKA